MSKLSSNLKMNQNISKVRSNELLSPDYIENNENNSRGDGSRSHGVKMYQTMNETLTKANQDLEEINDQNILIIKNLKQTLSDNAEILAKKEETLKKMMLYTGSNAETMETTIDLQAKNAELMKQIVCKNCEISELSASVELHKTKFECQVEVMRISDNNLNPTQEMIDWRFKVYQLLVQLKCCEIEHQKNLNIMQNTIDENRIKIEIEKKNAADYLRELKESKAEANLIRVQKQNYETHMEQFIELSKPLQLQQQQAHSRLDNVAGFLTKHNETHKYCMKEVEKIFNSKLKLMCNRIAFANSRLSTLRESMAKGEQSSRAQFEQEITTRDLSIINLRSKLDIQNNKEKQIVELTNTISMLKEGIEMNQSIYENNNYVLSMNYTHSQVEIEELNKVISCDRNLHLENCEKMKVEMLENNKTFSKNLVNYRLELNLLKNKLQMEKMKLDESKTASSIEISKLHVICQEIKKFLDENDDIQLRIEPEFIKSLDSAIEDSVSSDSIPNEIAELSLQEKVEESIDE